MNSTVGVPKKALVCRYFLNTGTCFFGDECQFLHTTTCNDLDVLPRQERSDSVSPCMEPHLYRPFASTGLPPESKLQSYINACKTGNDKQLKNCISPSDGDVVSSMSALGIESNRKKIFSDGPVLSQTIAFNGHDDTPVTGVAGVDFMPMTVNSSRLTHSMSSPSFTQFNSSLNCAGSTPFGRFGAADHNQSYGLGNNQVPHITSPISSPENSPLCNRRNGSPLNSSFHLSKAGSSGIASSSSSSKGNEPYGVSFGSMVQESFAGTTYFYASEENITIESNSPIILPDCRTYPGNPSHIVHMKPKANAPSFFLPDELRMDILHRLSLTMAQPNPEQYPDCPSDVDNYQNLCPLEPRSPGGPAKSTTFGFVTSIYKATHVKTGVHYCLRRIHGFRLSNTKCMQAVDLWRKIQHSNFVHLQEVFTTKAFLDHSMIFVYDYHAGADTLMNQYFNHGTIPTINGYANPSMYGHNENHPGQSKTSMHNLRQHAGLLPESLIWAYVVQLSSALRTIHAAGLACRALDPSKILITGKSRLRLNCCGIFDVLSFDASQQNKTLTAHFQQEDLLAFGKVVLALACNSLNSVQRENLQASLELVARSYSADLRNLILYLLSNQTRNRNINDIMPMIGARFYTQLDAAQLRSDVIENELSKEVENGRLFRLMVKLGCINERPEFNLDPTWSETGDRYLLKLFRDYLFHQVTEDGRPWIDMAHVIQCFNKLDAGVPEKICLMSRDEQNVLVVSYAELKQYFESSFEEILTASAQPKSQPS